MYKICIALALVAAFVQADDEPFSIGLGVLSPSYSQTVGKENVKVNFEQKDNGFSYSVGDPSSGTNTYLNFGSAATGANPAAYANANPSAYQGSSGYTAPQSGSSGYAAPQPGPSGYAAPQPGPSFNGYAGYQAPSYGAGANSGLGASGYGAGANSGLGASGYGAGANSGLGASGYGASGYSGLQNAQAGAPVAPNNYFGETARKPEETPSQILPAGFSYHGTDGQAFLRKGDSPNFIISEEPQESARGLAESSFLDSFKASGSGKVLQNGLVGYGPGGARGGIPVGGQAGPQFAGLVREHGGHSR